MDIKTYELEKEYDRYENLKSEMELSPLRNPFKSIPLALSASTQRLRSAREKARKYLFRHSRRCMISRA